MNYNPLAWINSLTSPQAYPFQQPMMGQPTFGPQQFNDPMGPMGGSMGMGGGAFPSNLQQQEPAGRDLEYDNSSNRDVLAAMLGVLATANTPEWNPQLAAQMAIRNRRDRERRNAKLDAMLQPQLQVIDGALVEIGPKYRKEGKRLVPVEQQSVRTVYQPKQAGAFEGSGMEAQMLNIYLDPSIPQDDPRKILAVQKLTQPRVVTTPEGTYAVPGYNLQQLQGGVAPAPGVAQSAPYGAPAGYGGIPGFTPKPPPAEKPPTEGERRVENTTANMRNLNSQATEYIPDTISALAGEWLPDAVKGYVQTPEYRDYNRIASEWAANLVQMRSGATARKDEIDAAVQNYWPQPGDDPDQVANKAAMREDAMAAAERAYLERTGGGGGGATSATDGAVDYVFNPTTGKLEPAR